MFLRNSVNQRRSLSRGAFRKHRETPNKHHVVQSYNHKVNEEEMKKSIKDQILNRLDKMTEEEIDRVSRQLDELSKADEEKKHNDDKFEREELELTQEALDKVGDLPQPNNFKEDKSITELSDYGSKSRDIRSRSSKRSSKSYVSKLRQELENERLQRQKLESEIEELKKLSSEISSKLGLAN